MRYMVRAGVSQAVAMSISGHQTPSMFLRYNITSGDDQREAPRRTEEYLNAQPAASNVVAIGKKRGAVENEHVSSTRGSDSAVTSTAS